MEEQAGNKTERVSEQETDDELKKQKEKLIEKGERVGSRRKEQETVDKVKGKEGGRRGAEEEERRVFKCKPVLMSLVRVWNSLFKAAIILINVVNEPLIAVMDLTLQLTTTYTPIGMCVHVECVKTHTHTQIRSA